MFNGPLSDRIGSIIDKSLGESWKKPGKKKKPVPTLSFLLKQPDEKSEDHQDVWETTQVNCPIPPRNPDQWVH